MHHGIKYRHIEINGIRTFYREAGAEHAPVVLPPHGYPSSSFQYRNFMPARWRLIAPDFPGCPAISSDECMGRFGTEGVTEIC